MWNRYRIYIYDRGIVSLYAPQIMIPTLCLYVQAKLDAVEKKIKVAEINTKRNNEDIVVLSNLTTTKETELQQLEEAFSKNTATMQDTGNR